MKIKVRIRETAKDRSGVVPTDSVLMGEILRCGQRRAYFKQRYKDDVCHEVYNIRYNGSVYFVMLINGKIKTCVEV